MRRPVRSAGGSGPAVLILSGCLLALTAWTAARAEMPGDVPDKIRFSLGGVAADTYTDGGLGSTTSGIGATINFEDTFALPENKDTWRFEGNWRINKRQFLDFGYL